jgi:hypothetical protein
VVCGIHNSVLEATGILQVEMDSAVLALVGGSGSGANVCLELVEAVCDDLVSRQKIDLAGRAKLIESYGLIRRGGSRN